MSKKLVMEITQGRDCLHNICGDCNLDDNIWCGDNNKTVPPACPLPDWDGLPLTGM